MFVQKLVAEARYPSKGSSGAAGYDLHASEDTVVPGHGKALISTGLAIQVPENCYGRIAPRSGMSSKYFTDIGAGVIDSDYRGCVKVLMFNHSDTELKISIGDRVAQLIIEKIENPDIVPVDSLDESDRGAKGFGSTGR